MSSNTLRCHLCQGNLDETLIKQHISGFHLKYRPYECTTCHEAGNSVTTATEEAMRSHITNTHSASNAGFHVNCNQMKEDEVDMAITAAVAYTNAENSLRSQVVQTESTDHALGFSSPSNLIFSQPLFAAISPQPSSAISSHTPPSNSTPSLPRVLWIGHFNVSARIAACDVRQHFAQYGPIVKAWVSKRAHNSDNPHWRFGSIEFETHQAACLALNARYCTIKGVDMQVHWSIKKN